MNIKLVIHTALKLEADIFIRYFKLKKITKIKGFNIYIDKKEEILLIISAIGPLNTCLALGYVKGHFPIKEDVIFFNFGLAGHKNLELGSIFHINSVKEEQSQKKIHLTQAINYQDNHQNLLTILPSEKITYHEHDILDNEAYYFVASCQRFVCKEFIFVSKIISDNQENEFSQKQAQNLLEAKSAELENYLDKLLAHQEKFKINHPLKQHQDRIEFFKLSFSEEIQVKNKLTSLLNLNQDITKILSSSNNKKELLMSLEEIYRKQNFTY